MNIFYFSKSRKDIFSSSKKFVTKKNNYMITLHVTQISI